MFKYGKPIPQLSIFCLIHGIINYVQINTYWSCIVPIGIFINLASNIILLASKKCFLTSQGLVGAGMNCRALHGKVSLSVIFNRSVVCLPLLWLPPPMNHHHNIIKILFKGELTSPIINYVEWEFNHLEWVCI